MDVSRSLSTVLSLSLATWGLLVTCAGPAKAEGIEPKVAVVKLRFVDVRGQDVASLQQTIREAVDFLKMQVVSEAMINYTEGRSKELLTDECLADAECWTQTALALSATMTLSGALTHSKTGWDADLSLFDRDLHRVTKRTQFSCLRCTTATFADRLRDAVVEMVRSNVETERGTIVVTTDPGGVEVRCDGHSIGKAPAERTEVAGPHIITVTAPTGEEKRRDIDLKPHARLSVDIELVPKPVPVAPVVAQQPPPPEKWSPRNLAAVGWTLVGAGVVGIVIGASLVGIDGHETGRRPNESGLLVSDRYSTAGAGGAVIAIGAAIGCVSAAPFYFAKKKRSAAKVSAAVGPNVAQVTVEGHW